MKLSIVFLALVGCSGDAFVGIPDSAAMDPDADPAGDASNDHRDTVKYDGGEGGADGADAVIDAPSDSMSCPYQGQTVCSDVIGAYCGHYASCCQQFPGNGYCFSWGSNKNQCIQNWTQSGYDCSSMKYGKCVQNAGLSCSNDIQVATCSEIFQATGPSSASQFPTCPAFWGQF